MKNRAIKFAAYYLLTFLTAVLCVFVLYRFFPKYLCYSVYDVKESDSYALEEIQIQEGEAFELFFSPLNPYLKGVAIHIRKENTANNEYWEGTEASAAWYEGDKVVKHNKVHVKYNGYVEFPLEKWVDTEKTYRLSIVFDGDAGDKYYLMTGPKEIGPAEQEGFTVGGKAEASSLYVRLIYGSYSRKLLVLWMAAFWCIAGFAWRNRK